jgi:hypothetical protein
MTDRAKDLIARLGEYEKWDHLDESPARVSLTHEELVLLLAALKAKLAEVESDNHDLRKSYYTALEDSAHNEELWQERDQLKAQLAEALACRDAAEAHAAAVANDYGRLHAETEALRNLWNLLEPRFLRKLPIIRNGIEEREAAVRYGAPVGVPSDFLLADLQWIKDVDAALARLEAVSR